MTTPGKSLPSEMMVNGRMVSDPIFDLLSSPSRSYTAPGSTQISALCRAIESFLHHLPLLRAYAMPLRVTNGADVVVVPPFLDPTLQVITPYGTLLLSSPTVPDVTIAASVTSFIKGFMEGPLNMADEEKSRIKELEEQTMLLSTLHSIALESNDAETVRMAYAGLQGTEIGRNYLAERQYQL